MMARTSMESALLETARSRVPSLREGAAESERARRVPADVAHHLARAGFFRMLVPEAIGGAEVSPACFVEVLATLAEGDAAAAWHVMTGATTGLLLAYLPEEGARELLGPDGDGILAGVFAPMGRATPTEGGYRLSGRWPFASGCENAAFRAGGALVIEDGKPRCLPDGTPEILTLFVPARDSQVIDTWSVSGLRGTGSHDLAVDDLFVPAHRVASVLRDPPRHARPLYAFPLFGLLSLGVSAVSVGIARAALDAVYELAKKKKKPGGGGMADQSHVQMRLAEAEGEARAGHALLTTTLEEVWADAQATGRITLAQRASLRLAATHATRASVRAVDIAYGLGGGSSIYESSPLQRHFRDVHTITQHVMVQESTYKAIGRVLLELPVDANQL